jgi:hypothetical protein
MIDVKNIWKTEKNLKIATGLSIEEADELVAEFENEMKIQKSLTTTTGGRPAKLDFRDVFLMFMLFYRHYVTFELLGLLFEVDGSTAKRSVSDSERIIKDILEKKSLSHLIAQSQEANSRPPLSSAGKYISMVLNSRSEDPVRQ